MTKKIKKTDLIHTSTRIFNTNTYLFAALILLVISNLVLLFLLTKKEVPPPIVVQSSYYTDISKNSTSIIEDAKSHTVSPTDFMVFIENIVEHFDLKSEYSRIKNLNFLLNVSDDKLHKALLKKQSRFKKTEIKEVLNELISIERIEKPNVTSHLFFKVNYKQRVYYKKQRSQQFIKKVILVFKPVNRLDYLLGNDEDLNKNIGGKYYGVVLTEADINVDDI